MIGCSPGTRLKPAAAMPVAKVRGVVPQALAQRGVGFEHVEHAQARGGDERRNAVGEQVRPRALPQPGDDFLAARRVAAARAAERLAERAGENVDAIDDAAQLVRAAAARADEASRVRVVDHHQRVVAVGQVADVLEARDHAVHREHAVGRDQAHAALARFLQARFQLVEVVVGIAQALRFAQAHAVDDARVVQRVADHCVLLVEQRLEQPAVRIEARRVEDRVLGAEERGSAAPRAPCGSPACRR